MARPRRARFSGAVRLATLTHDMERAFPGPDQPVIKTLSDPEYERAHSVRSARIVGRGCAINGRMTGSSVRLSV